MWKPGQSGNPKGRLTEQVYTNELRAAVNVVDPKRKRRKLQLIAERAANDAYLGEPTVRHAARVHIADRLDGKPHQSTSVSMEDKTVAEMTMDELLAIAARGRAKRDEEEQETQH